MNKPHSEETKRKISQSLRGKHLSETTKEKLRLISGSKRHSEATKHKLSIMRLGDKNPSWKGGTTTDKDGYVLVKRLDHPLHNGAGYVRQHRLIYEEYHKCIILPWIEIHHINNIKNDNRIENLILVTKSEHTRLRHMTTELYVREYEQAIKNIIE